MHLLADIGGTNARFALLDATSREPRDAMTLATADFATLVDAVSHYLVRCGVRTVQDCAMAIATPILGDHIQMTNHHWAFSIEETRQRLGLTRLLVVNDFAALAMSLPTLPRGELRQIGGGKPVSDAPLALIGAGTGLGVSALVPAGGRWVPIAGEGGHVTLCAGNEREAAIIAHCRARFGHVSAERLVSGPGIVNLHDAVAALAGASPVQRTPAEITQHGQAGTDAICLEALETFCGLLGAVAGNLVLTLGARGGLYIGGGIMPKLGPYFERSPFRRRFEAKGRFSEYLAAIPAYVILSEYAALRGVASLFTDT